MDTRILMSILVIGVVAMAAGAGTFAYFSDTEESTGNTFTAGTLDLVLSDWTANVQEGKNMEAEGGVSFTISNAAPGESADVEITLTNEGSITANDINMHLTATDSEPTDDTEPEEVAEGEIGENVYDISSKIEVAEMEFDGKDILAAVIEELGAGDELTLNELSCNTLDLEALWESVTGTDWSLGGGDNTNLHMKLLLQDDTGNEYQGDQSEIEIVFNLYQVEQE